MPPVILAAAALRDLERLRSFLRPVNLPAARRAGEVILQAVRGLSTNPRMGRLVEGLPEAFRELVIAFGDSGYVVRYRIEDDRVIVLAVRHQKEASF